MIHTTIFSCIAVTKDLINCNSLVDYARFLIQRIAVEVMFGLDTEVFAVCVNAIERLIV